MPRHLADEKVCNACGLVKPASEFVKNRSRNDGLMDKCKTCMKFHVPKKREIDYDRLQKECSSCECILSARCFVPDQSSPDRLSEKCRSCKSWKHRDRSPTPDQRIAFETALVGLFLEAEEKYDPNRERIAFENYIAKHFIQRGLAKDWKLPIWISKQTLVD